MATKLTIDRRNHWRAILTDTLPYELPFFFSNENLYREASCGFRGLPALVTKLLHAASATKPVTYQVQKGGGAFRNLSVPHPAAQLRMAEFYKKFDQFIVNACSRSSYSLRFPNRVGTYYFRKQYIADGDIEDESAGPDIDPVSLLPERRWASTYFAYLRYPQVYKFFLSSEFMLLEQKYRYMLKLDVARCFESIYTHSISWAVRGKEFSKDHKDASFFEADFDKLIRESNWGETNGILIGPEISRIFAEIIMQSIDVQVAQILSGRCDFEIRRYVDDYFIFSNSNERLAEVRRAIEKCISHFNLHLNQSKTTHVERPLVSSLSVARSQVMEAVGLFMTKAMDSLDESKACYFGHGDSEALISKIRLIARSNEIDYPALASPALGVVCAKLRVIRSRIDSKAFTRRKQAMRVIDLVLKVCTFLFQMDIRAATTHKIAKVFYETSLICAATGISRATFTSQIEDVVRSSLSVEGRAAGPEIINLLTAADAVSFGKRIVSPQLLREAMGLNASPNTRSLDYFDLTSILYFGKSYGSYKSLRELACDMIEQRLAECKGRLHLHASEVMLFFDYIGCPYVSDARRLAEFRRVSARYGGSTDAASTESEFRLVKDRLSFITWTGASQFRLLLERKELQPAYDS